jgi:hypothetical protein
LGTKLRQKACAVAEHVADVFQQHPSETEHEEEEALFQLLGAPYQLKPTMKCFKIAEFQEVISNLNPRKPLGYNHIASKILNVLLE